MWKNPVMSKKEKNKPNEHLSDLFLSLVCVSVCWGVDGYQVWIMRPKNNTDGPILQSPSDAHA